MKALIFDLKLLQPVLIARTEPGDENSAESVSSLPGSSIRGALIGGYMARKGLSRLDLKKDGQARGWFFEDLCFLNAYPTLDGQRALPVPLSWRVEKDYRGDVNARIWDAAGGELQESFEMPATLEEPFFVQENGGRPRLINPQRSMEIHNASSQRRIKREGDSQVFRYDSLAEGQVFTAVIVGEDAGDMAAAVGLVDGARFSLGRSRSAHYGLVEACNARVEDDWQEGSVLPENTPLNGTLALVLTSEALLYDDCGQPVFDLDALVGAKQHLSAWYRTRITGGFNRAWGLPLPQGLALQAGSVFVYDLAQVDVQKVNKLLLEGVGSRRVEGFGRVRALANPAVELQRMDLPFAWQEQPEEELGAESKKIARLVGLQCLSGFLEERLASAVADIHIRHMDDRSQLSKLRTMVRQESDSKNLKPVADYIKNLKASAEKLKAARVVRAGPGSAKGERLNEWLEGLVHDSEASAFWWQQPPRGEEKLDWNELLALDENHKAEMVGKLPDADALAVLKVTFLRRLIDAVLQKAAREIQHGERERARVEVNNGGK